MTSKLSLPAFLKIFTSASVPMSKAMAYAGKIYKTNNTRELLSQLTDAKLVSLGINEKEDRKQILQALRTAGLQDKKGAKAALGVDPAASSSPSSSKSSKSSPRKRKRDADLDKPIPNGSYVEGSETKLDFEEVLDADVVMNHSTHVNRAPIMTAWSMIVAEKLGFKREEALSIASVYTELNAISRGVASGIFDSKKADGMEAKSLGSQPYVELMGRRPLFMTQSSQWRALSKGDPVPPSTAFSYVSRSLRQTAPYVIGAMRLLAETYSPRELNEKGFGIYAEFRPAVTDWGARSEVRCKDILALRKPEIVGSAAHATHQLTIAPVENTETDDTHSSTDPPSIEGPSPKKSRGMTLEEYEDALDESEWADLPLDELP
ncbi:hypothetical protein SISSUDRAFT_1131050 [Sistotremastrum suecicum HHB10207 ss-3]|uniref:Uncharacterized protein n=1 Tax=Sistotremastrum suecicum HHB10207 ss-3 TaxID=1314776 RepID=A0A166APX1_9AGAM|nr:hypothetical protein SISSUDRAFT_1131050 [Sistotremastrum suecicum HHB10207 ss-3]